jgi:hypothetical protein
VSALYVALMPDLPLPTAGGHAASHSWVRDRPGRRPAAHLRRTQPTGGDGLPLPPFPGNERQ